MYLIMNGIFLSSSCNCCRKISITMSSEFRIQHALDQQQTVTLTIFFRFSKNNKNPMLEYRCVKLTKSKQELISDEI